MSAELRQELLNAVNDQMTLEDIEGISFAFDEYLSGKFDDGRD